MKKEAFFIFHFEWKAKVTIDTRACPGPVPVLSNIAQCSVQLVWSEIVNESWLSTLCEFTSRLTQYHGILIIAVE